MTAGLDILGVGLDIPPATDTRALCRSAGADTREFRGWDNVCVAREDEHPSTMGAAALRAALDDAAISPTDLGIVVSAGMSRDYLPSWSLSTEIMKAAGTGPAALGIDLTLGCLGTLAALNVAHGWLTGGGYAGIVTAERWAYTVDRSVTTTMTLWAHSDGAGALVVGLGTGDPALGVYQGGANCCRNSDQQRVIPPHSDHGVRRCGGAGEELSVRAGGLALAAVECRTRAG